MIGIILRVVAAILFLVAALDQTFLKQTPPELVAWGLFAWVLATLVGGWGPAWTWQRPPQ